MTPTEPFDGFSRWFHNLANYHYRTGRLYEYAVYEGSCTGRYFFAETP
jgi:hypothetical protein